MANEMSYPLGSAVSGGAGLSDDYAKTVATFNDIYNKRQELPFNILAKASEADYTSALANRSRIIAPLEAQKMMNDAKMSDLQLASANMRLQQQHRELQQQDEALQGYNHFNNSMTDFITPDGSYDVQSLTEAQPPPNLTPFQRSGWIKARDEVFAQAGQADYLNKANQIKQLNAQVELANQANIAQAKQEMATLGKPLTDDNVQDYLDKVIFPRRQAEIAKQAAITTNPNILPNAKGGFTVMRGLATNGILTPRQLNDIENLDNQNQPLVDAYIDRPSDKKTQVSLEKNFNKIAWNLKKSGLTTTPIDEKIQALNTLEALNSQLHAASTEIQTAEKAASHWIGSASEAQKQAVLNAHAKYDSIENKIKATTEILKKPIHNSIGNNSQQPVQAVSTPEKAPYADEQVVLAKAKAAIENGAPRDAVEKRLRDNGIDPNLLDVPAQESQTSEEAATE